MLFAALLVCSAFSLSATGDDIVDSASDTSMASVLSKSSQEEGALVANFRAGVEKCLADDAEKKVFENDPDGFLKAIAQLDYLFAKDNSDDFLIISNWNPGLLPAEALEAAKEMLEKNPETFSELKSFFEANEHNSLAFWIKEMKAAQEETWQGIITLADELNAESPSDTEA